MVVQETNKIIKKQSSRYLSELIATAKQEYLTRHKNSIPLFNVKHKNSFFLSTIIEQNKLDSNIRNSKSLVLFKKRTLAFVRPSANSTFHCHNPNDLKLITRLRLGLTHFSPMSHFYTP